MIKIGSRVNAEEAIRRIIHAINFSEEVLPFAAITYPDVDVPAGATPTFGGLVVDRSVFRLLLPDAKWLVYAAGFANSGDGNPLTISLQYQKDDTTFVLLGSTTTSAGAYRKVTLGPFDVFGTAGVPAGETVPIVRLQANKGLGANGQMSVWNIWLRLCSAGQ